MKIVRQSRLALFLLLLAGCFLFWFITAPASMAVQRIASMGGGPIARLIIRAAGLYEAPVNWFYKFPPLKRFDEFMADWWCDVLDAPETTP